MGNLLELLFAPLQPFVGQAHRAFLVAVFFVVLTVFAKLTDKAPSRSYWSMILAVFAWVLFGINEYVAHVNKSNIRIDLLLFGPPIIVISIYAVASFVKGLIRRS